MRVMSNRWINQVKSGRGHEMEGQEPCNESIATFQNNPGSPQKISIDKLFTMQR